MTRALYRCLLWLHPPAFQREFAGEMLWIFDQAVATHGPRPLLADAFRSLARQWLLRSGSWKIAAALALAMLQVTAGGAGILFFGRRQVAHLVATPSALEHTSLAHAPITMEFLVFFTVLVVAGLILMVLLLVSSLNRISRRSRSCSNYAR